MNWNIDTADGMANAVAWQTNMIAGLTQGGRWIVPRSWTVYEIDHENKVARRCDGFVPEPTIERVFRAMGWKVVDASARVKCIADRCPVVGCEEDGECYLWRCDHPHAPKPTTEEQ